LDEPSEELQGRYTITGEIISTSRFDDELPEDKMLLVYEMERTGDVDLSSLSSESQELLEGELREMNSSVQTQLGVVTENDVVSETTTKSAEEGRSGTTQSKSDNTETTTDKVESSESDKENNDSIIEKASSTVSDVSTAVSETASKVIKKVSEWF
jgi:hypothetical protein